MNESTLLGVGATLVHFGQDECARLLVLRQAGFAVKSCGTSLRRLQAKLRDDEVAAIAVTEDVPVLCEEVMAVARATTKAPLILFAGVDRGCDPSDFDLVIYPGVRVQDWIQKVRELIERSHVVRADSASARAASLELRQQSRDTREETEKTIEKMRKNCEEQK